MASESKDINLGEYLDFKNGKSSPERRNEGRFPIYGANGIIDFCDKNNANENTIIIGRVGSYCGSIYLSKKRCWVTDNAIICIPKNPREAAYWFYKLSSLNLNFFRSGSGQPLLNQKILNSIKTKVLNNEKERVFIGNYISNFDQKIQLNKQMNETLEQMAQALFHSWFVNFDPVIDNALDAGNEIPEALQARAEKRRAVRNAADFKPLPADIRTLFPNEFDQSIEPSVGIDGWIPKGWKIRQLSDVCEILNGFAFKSKDYVGKGNFVLRTKNFSYGEVKNAHDDVFLPDEFVTSHKKFLCKPFDYHLVMVGASIGKCAIIYDFQLPALRNQNMWCFRATGDSIISQQFIKYTVDELVKKNIGLASGSAREFFRKNDFGKQYIGIGHKIIQEKFKELCLPFFKKKAITRFQIESLETLRDTLLPKLISGELRLDQLDAVEELSQL